MPHDDPITSGNKMEWCRWTWVLALHLYPARAPLSLHANNLCKSTSLYKWCFFIAILLFWRSSSSRVTQILWADVMFKYYVYIIIMSVYLIWCWCCNLIAINLTSSVLANVVLLLSSRCICNNTLIFCSTNQSTIRKYTVILIMHIIRKVLMCNNNNMSSAWSIYNCFHSRLRLISDKSPRFWMNANNSRPVNDIIMKWKRHLIIIIRS